MTEQIVTTSRVFKLLKPRQKSFELMTTPLITSQQTYTNNVLFIFMNLYKHRCNDLTESSIKLPLLHLITATPLMYITPAIHEETHQ